MNDIYILVEDDSTYNFMINKMFLDIFKKYNVEVCIEDCLNNKILNCIKERRFQKVTKGILDFLLVDYYKLKNVLLSARNKYDNIYVLFLNSTFLESRFPINVLKKYKKISNNIVYILFYIDIVSHPCSYHANRLREAGIFDMIYTVDKDE